MLQSKRPLLMVLMTVGFCSWNTIFVRASDEVEPSAPWSFSPVKAVVVPDRKFDQSRNAIDQFLLDRLSHQKLSFAPIAERSTWLRRVSLDLTGLPPTYAEVQEFEKDTAADAEAKVVKRLLASPRFGERAALFWLDLVRYAESDGFRADAHRPNAWRYRDYVIESFNSNKPYDRFIKEQLAGDELDPNDPACRVAVGYLRHYPDEYNAVNLEQRRHEIITDITDTTGAAFLGLTIGCARCHDHKTDAILQSDYFRLQAFFAGYFEKDLPVDPAQEAEYAAKRKVWEEKTAAIRAKIDALEQPIAQKAMVKQRERFQDAYARLLDLDDSQLSPLERQIKFMIGKQVYAKGTVTAKQLPAAKQAEYEQLKKELAAFDALKPAPLKMAMSMGDVGPVVPPTHLLKRGDWTKPGKILEPGFITAIEPTLPECKPTAHSSGRRIQLANWIASPKNPLTARVMVNRIWQQLFGTGIVASSSDFGHTGEKPTHPELLDYLAAEFVRSGWNIKRIYELIALSGAYRQSSLPSPEALRVDPENRLLARMPRKRLDGEAIRDVMLSISGTLNLKAGGPSVYPELPPDLKAADWKVSADPAERNRRGVYVAVKRNLRYPLFALFDSPDRTETCSRRYVTTTAPQALAMINDTLTLKFAQALADRAIKQVGQDPEKLANTLIELALTRKATSEELSVMTAFLKNHPAELRTALADLSHAVMNLNELLMVD